MFLIHFPAFLLQICSCCLVVIHLVCINWGINLQTLNIIHTIMNINHKKPIVLVGDRICRNIFVTICFARTPQCFFIPSWTAVQSSEISTCIFRGSAAHQKSAWSLFVYLYLPWTHRDKKSASERLALQQKETNGSAFCSWWQHILTCRSHYITRWKWPERHVRMNQFAAQPLVQLISWVGGGQCGAQLVEYRLPKEQ